MPMMKIATKVMMLIFSGRLKWLTEGSLVNGGSGSVLSDPFCFGGAEGAVFELHQLGVTLADS